MAHDGSKCPNHGSKKKLVGMHNFITKAPIFERKNLSDEDSSKQQSNQNRVGQLCTKNPWSIASIGRESTNITKTTYFLLLSKHIFSQGLKVVGSALCWNFIPFERTPWLASGNKNGVVGVSSTSNCIKCTLFVQILLRLHFNCCGQGAGVGLARGAVVKIGHLLLLCTGVLGGIRRNDFYVKNY
jgi:hypothetical protein